MSVKTPQSRMESNREIRRILVKNGVDTTKIQYSCHGRTISLSGGMYKDGGQDMALSNIEAIFNEFNRLGYQYYCELENWSICEGSISKKGSKPTEEKQSKAQEKGKPGKVAA